MFKLESYITPIILSYANRYIKNFKPEDTNVSLWGGEAAFHNLELNLEVLEEELQLPFSFVSGSIRELTIYVPWTKITSEPIKITINTIECILNLKGKEGKTVPKSKPKEKKPPGQTNQKVVEAPPGYIQSLINKIVSNISVHINNLILKYVEEDIVLSMNVKLLKVQSANEGWEPTFSDLSPAQVILRKVISISDLTLCLDRRNASGKIEVYQEPVLYKCSMAIHLLRHYHSATASRASTTRLDVYCNSMEFSMTEQQMPMLLRILMLVYTLQQKQLKPELQNSTSDHQSGPSDQKETSEGDETWTGWAWSYVSSVLPAPWEEEMTDEQWKIIKGHTLQCGFYVDTLSFTFKVSESSSDRGYYSQKKLRHFPMLTLELQGIYSDTVIHGLKWFCCTGGVTQAFLKPAGFCSCGQAEVTDLTAPYLKLGSPANLHKTDSLFDANAVENKGGKRVYNTTWDLHMATTTEQVLLEKTPAFAFDYAYQMEPPNDRASDISLSDIGSNLEFSNFSESASLRLCIGPFRLRVCSGMFHRLDTLQVAASFYDYPPYFIPKPDLPFEDLLPPSAEDFDALTEFIPQRSMRVTFFAPVIELELMDHPYFEANKTSLFKRSKKSSACGIPSTPSILPKITIECQFIDISQQFPMYANRLVHTTCQLPEPPDQLFHACYVKRDIKIVGLLSRLMTNAACQSIVLTPSSMTFNSRSILKPQYWINADIPHEEMTFESESLTINSTKAKMLVIYSIIEKLISRQTDPLGKSIFCSSLLTDASRDNVFPHMELCVEGIRFRKVTTNSTQTTDLSVTSVQAFIFENLSKFDVSVRNPNDIQQVLFISGPDPTEKRQEQDLPLLTTTIQFPLRPDVQKHPPILIFNLQEIRICADPLLCKWLLYVPRSFLPRTDFGNKSVFSEASSNLIDTPRKPSTHQFESVHSSSDRETPHTVPTKTDVANEEQLDMQEQIYNFLKTWLDVWKGMFLCGDISQCTIYFPMVSLSAVGSRGIQEAVEYAISQESPPDIMVITLPFANIRSAQRQSVSKYLHTLPVDLPPSVWSVDKSSFPWTMSISELSCYTIQSRNKLNFLKPVSLSATVALSNPSVKSEVKISETSSVVDSPCTKIELGSLGVCVHIDMTPVVISTSEIQVYLFASIIYGLMEVAINMFPETPKKTAKLPEIAPPVAKKESSIMSPTVVKDNTADSVSEVTQPSVCVVKPENLNTDTVKLTAWIQWTITRFTIELLSSELRSEFSLNQDDFESIQPRLKLVLDAEDIVSSLDFQSVYLKVKSKIGSASVRHYKRSSSSSKWQPGPYSGIVMRLRDDLIFGQHQEENSFISITITRASCQHTHTLWGAVQKHSKAKKAEIVSSVKSRYITEVVVNIQPLDFVVSMSTLRSFYMVLIPLVNIPVPSVPTESTSSGFSNINNQTLPLAYFESQDIRLIMPVSDLDLAEHDTFIMQIQKIALNPQAVNPICRTPIRSDIYDQAAHARILNIPGSEVEDRQYQLDISGISFCTGAWDDVKTIVMPTSDVLSNLRGLSENPALEWNNLEKGQPNSTPYLNLRYIIEKFDISILAAPAMVYKDTTTICGHAIEVNFVSDIIINISLHQIKLSSALLRDFLILATPFIVEDGIVKKPQIRFPYPRLESSCHLREECEDGVVDITKDSGIETSDIKSNQSNRGAGSSLLLTKPSGEISDKHHLFPRPPNQIPYIYASIPLEAVVTSGKIVLSVYQVNESKPVLAKHKGKKKRISKKADEDQGYDASEESFDEKSDNYKKFTPLLFISFTQPNAFFAKQHLSRRLQASCFNVNLKLGATDHLPVSHTPLEADFPINLFETKPGTPHCTTGISPAFFTLKYSTSVGKNAKLEIDFSKPMKLLCKTSKWMYILVLKDKIVDTFKCGGGLDSVTTLLKAASSKNKVDVSNVKPCTSKHNDSYSKFQEIKELMQGITSVAVYFDQVIFAIAAESNHEIHIGFQRFKSDLSVSNRPEKLNIKFSFGCLTVTVLYDNYKKLLLNPWSIKFDVGIFWENWQAIDSDPQIQLTAKSDSIIIDLTAEQLKCVDMVIKDLKDFSSAVSVNENQVAMLDTEVPTVVEKDQYYKDDLRAGAFQFVDSSGDNTSELPLPYQVMFWNKSTSAMAWRYPQPRALTKVRVFPVPYKMALGSQENLLVLCHLEYWSEYRNCYMPYTHFYLSESEVCHLNLPKGRPQQIVASTWRVVITTTIDKSDNIESCSYNVTLSPRALAACMRIDSYFNKSLIPQLNAALYISKIEVNLYNFFPKDADTKLPDCFKLYKPDLTHPENQKFLTLLMENLTSYTSVWSLDVLAVEIGCSTQCSVLDYAFLTDQTFVPPFSSKLELNLSKGLQCNFISKPVQVKFGPSIAHTLAVSTQMWQRNTSTESSGMDFIVVTRYVIRNDTNALLRFGQDDTEESILLMPRQFHLYSWRSQKKQQSLRLSLEKVQWEWSEPMPINEDVIRPVQFKNYKDTVVFICVKSLSKTQKQITVYGQLTVYNLLAKHLEMKVVEAMNDKESKEAEFKNAETHVVLVNQPGPSVVLNRKKNYCLRLRFYGLESYWTGDIPLREHLTGAQPWLVKVPLQERGQFLSVWCRIVVQDFNRSNRILAMIWPLFMVRSNLPMNTKVEIATPTLGVNLHSEIQGKGVLQQLYCPGTIDHSHQLTFELAEGCTDSNTNPYVPLNYSLVDQQKFFKKSSKEDIDTILTTLSTFGDVKWPYFGDEIDSIDWNIDSQPLTQVQVRYQNASQYSSALMVELLPWCLTVNTLGATVAIMLNNVELCQVKHHGMVAPPPLEEAFHIGVCSENNWFFSGPLQLAKSDWSQTFYMPKITGTIPLDGTIKTAIQCDSHLCMVSITSSISNEIRLLKLSSTHVLSNYMSMQVQVLCLVVAENKIVFKVPEDVFKYCFTVSPHSQKSHSGIPIIQWCTLRDEGEISSNENALYILFCVEPSQGWSCPIRVDKPLIRKPFAIRNKDCSISMVLTAQDLKGQIYLAIQNDPRPQLYIDNKTSIPLLCGQSLPDDTGVAIESEHFNWNCKIDAFKSVYYNMPLLAEKFPELPQINFSEKISFAYDSGEDSTLEWSAGVSIVNNNSLFIRIPHYGDVKVTVVNTACTTIFTIESVSKVEISAKDIRVRLSLRDHDPIPAFQVASRGLEQFVKGQIELQGTSRNTTELQFANAEPPSHHIIDFDSHSQSTSSILARTIPLGEKLKSLEINVFVKSLTLTLLTDFENDGQERWELASFACDSILVKAVQTEDLKVQLSISDLQFDNQLYTRESFDFPVILVGQERKPDRKINILSIPIDALLESIDSDPLVNVDFIWETCNIGFAKKLYTGVKQTKITLNPMLFFVEDVYITRLVDYLKTLSPIQLVMWPRHNPNLSIGASSNSVNIPELVFWQCQLLAQPLTMRNFVMNPVSILLSVHSSVKLYIALDQSPLQFSKFERRRLLTTHYRLGHALTMHYLSGAIFGAGWVVSSLELLGSPGGLARAMGTGLRDFVSLPYRGLWHGPWAFLIGITNGSASLMRHFTAGTLQSVTKLASSVARNLDRLTLDEEHQKRAEQQRRQRPQGVTQGFLQGMTSLGISLLGAVGGIAHHPLQSVMSDDASPRSFAAGVGLGLVGVLTKPLSGAAELVALTGQGLLQGAGWNSLPDLRATPQTLKLALSNNSMLKYNWKFINLPDIQILHVIEATRVHSGTIFAAVALILTTDSVVIVDLDVDDIKKVISLEDITINQTNDPTLLSLKLAPPPKPRIERGEDEVEMEIEMDPIQRARVADYVRSTVGLLQLPEGNSEHSDISISPLNTPQISPSPSSEESTVLNFYVSNQKISYFCCLLTLAKQHSTDDHFPVL